MDFSELLSKRRMPETVLVILFTMFLILGYPVPDGVAQLIDSSIGKVVVIIIAIVLLAYSNPILGVLGLLVAYQLLRGASIKTGMAGLEAYYPTEEKKWSPFSPTHQFPYTLEEEVVKTMTTKKFNTEYVKAPFAPILENTHDAATLV